MHKVSNPSDPKRDRLLDAATAVFARYGFRRASMGDIAAEAGVSRPALYLHFRSKQDALRLLANRLRDRALAAARGAWRQGASLADNLEATLLAKDAEIFPLLHGSPHGAELLAADAGLTAEIAGDLERSFRAVLAARLREAAEAGLADLACVDGDADALAGVVAAALKAIVAESGDETAFRRSIRRLARVAAASVRP